MHYHLVGLCAVIARTGPSDVRKVLESYKGCDIPTEYIRRTKDYQR